MPLVETQDRRGKPGITGEDVEQDLPDRDRAGCLVLD